MFNQRITPPSTDQPSTSSVQAQMSQSIDWYHEGESRTITVESVQITIRFIGRKGRRGRIAVVAPAGAEFRSDD